MACFDVRLFSPNIRGIRAKRKSIFTFIKQKKFDVICSQETNFTKDVYED